MKKLLFPSIIAFIFGLTACNRVPQKPEEIELPKGETIVSAGVHGENIYYLTTDTAGVKRFYYKYSRDYTKRYVFVEK